MNASVHGTKARPTELAFTFAVEGAFLPAVLHRPLDPGSTQAVVLVVGGPQTRVGSHRQFVLLARYLAAHGIPVLRFDCRGMGDAEGDPPGFEQIGPDIEAALAVLFQRLPELKEAVIWGLCDAASAALLFAWTDTRVTGLVLLNPWVRTEEGEARVRLSHYYRRRLTSGAFWRKALSGKWRIGPTVRSLLDIARRLRAGRRSRGEPDGMVAGALPERMAEGLARFQGRVLLILSGDDLTAAEFEDVVARSEPWQRLLAAARVERFTLPAANHTFARLEWRTAVAERTRSWLQGRPDRAPAPAAGTATESAT